jgi:serine/arginine repetitive matrix protein 2
VQVLLILIMYRSVEFSSITQRLSDSTLPSRISTARAKDIFLNTYYDPYYPELHLYATKPDTFRLSMAHASHWSVFTIPDTLRRGGWKVAALEAWNGMAMAVWDWQMQVWDTWGTGQTVSWPPT